MKPYTRIALLITLLAAGSCIGSSEEANIGTESGNPRTFGTCDCESDSDCEGLFDWQIDMYDASVRKVECSADTRACRAVLEAGGQCYVNLAVDSRAHDCTLTDQQMFEQSDSDPDRPLDEVLSGERCE